MKEQRRQLLSCCEKLSKGDLKKMAGVSDAIANLNHDRFQSFDQQPEKQACLAFDGPAFRGLQAATFDDSDQAFAQQHLRILSGLYGILRPYDLIQPYRLEMGSKLETPKGKDLYSFWGDQITEQLNADLLAAGAKMVVNCASQEYFKAVRRAKVNATVVECQFPGPSVYAKQARGMMCRFIVQEKIADVAGLKRFSGYGDNTYAFSEAQSTDCALVFLRVAAAKAPATTKATTPTSKSNGKTSGASKNDTVSSKRKGDESHGRPQSNKRRK